MDTRSSLSCSCSTTEQKLMLSCFWLIIIALIGLDNAFISTPRDTTSFVGDTVVVTCSVNNGDKFSGWQFRQYGSESSLTSITDQSANSYKHYSINTTIPGQHDLIINGTQAADAGGYFCQEGFTSSPSGRIALIDAVFTTNISDAISLKDTVVLSCRLFIYGSETLNCSITVCDQSNQVTKQQSTSAVLNNTLLPVEVIVNSTDIFGPYYCTVACYGKSKTLIVSNISQIYTPVTEVGVNITGTVCSTKLLVGTTIQCLAVANPPAIFYWYKHVNNNWQFVQNGSLLTLRTLGQHTLHCTAYNVVRKVTYSATLADFTVIVVNQTVLSTIPPVYSAASATSSNNIHGPSVGIGIGISIAVALVVAVIYISIRHRNKDTRTERLYESAMSPSTAAVNDGVYTDLQQIGTHNNSGYEMPALL